jgi:hypothetical protein
MRQRLPERRLRAGRADAGAAPTFAHAPRRRYTPAVRAALASCALGLAAAALLAEGSRARRALALAIAAATLGAPWLAPADHPLARALLALGAGWGLARILDLARGLLPRPGPLRRVLHAFALVDTRSFAVAPRALDLRLLAKFAVAAPVAAAALGLATGALSPPPPAPAGLALRWAAAAIFVLALADALDGLVRAAFRAGGVRLRTLHRAPLRATTLREFWGRRWNRVVQAWLSEHAFGPVARRHGPAAGTLAAFGASALLHAYLLVAALGPGAAATWAAFFLLHGGLVVAAARLGVARWPPALARAWTLGARAVTAPLFVEPMLRCL